MSNIARCIIIAWLLQITLFSMWFLIYEVFNPGTIDGLKNVNIYLTISVYFGFIPAWIVFIVIIVLIGHVLITFIESFLDWLWTGEWELNLI